jgi:tripartite-type tricarboxylate transporter receptor subunit TctC
LKRIIVAAAILAGAFSALAQSTYPNRPIRLVVPTPAGSVSDVAIRVIADDIQKETGAVFVVDNRAGGLGVIGTEAVQHAQPDGYTFLASAISTHAQAPYLIKNLRYDPVRDFEPVSRLILVQWALVADPALKFKGYQDLVASAKARPKALAFGYGTVSALASVAAFNNQFGIDALPVPYKGQPLALMDIAAGRVSYMLVDTNVSAALINEGKVQALAIASESRSPLLPNVPTFKELGVNGVEFVGWLGLHAPARTPRPVRQWMSDQVQKALAKPAVVDRLKALGVLPGHQNPDQFDRFVRSELDLWQKRITDAGIKPE